jgi:hypothetical protein
VIALEVTALETAVAALAVAVNIMTYKILTSYYARGDVECKTGWLRPSWESMKNYLTYIKENSNIFERYRVDIRGSVLYNISDSIDLDLYLIGPYETEQLEKDLNYLLDIGLNKYNILIDAKWCSEIFLPVTYQNIIDTNFKWQKAKAIHLTNEYAFVNDSVSKQISEPSNVKIENISKNLVIFDISLNFKDKFKNLYKIKENQNKIICQILNVEEFLMMTKTDFFMQTNCY